jgi:DNA-binding XRE family transcriptional regulator
MPHTAASASNSKFGINVSSALRLERAAFGAKVRAARAVLGLSQDEFAERVGLTQKSVHRIEHGMVEPKLSTIITIEKFWARSAVVFEDLPDGGFRLVVTGALLAA